MEKLGAENGLSLGQRIKVVMHQFLPDRFGQPGLGVKQQAGHIVLQGSSSPTLVVDKVRPFLFYHDIGRLEIPEQEVVGALLKQVVSKPAEIIFQGLFVEGNAHQFEEVVLEVVEIPHHGVAVESGSGVALAEINAIPAFELQVDQAFEAGFVESYHGWIVGVTVYPVEKHDGAQVFQQVAVGLIVDGVDGWNRYAGFIKRCGERQKGIVLSLVCVPGTQGRKGTGL